MFDFIKVSLVMVSLHSNKTLIKTAFWVETEHWLNPTTTTKNRKDPRKAK